MEGHAEAVAEDDGGHGLLVHLGGIEALAAGRLAPDVHVEFTAAV